MQATTPVRGLQHVVPTFPVVQLFHAPAGTAPANPYPQFVPLYQPGSQQFFGPQPAFVPPQPQRPVQPRPAIPPRGSSTGWRSVVPRPSSLPGHPGCPQGAANPQAGGISGPSHGRSSPAGSVPAGGAAGIHSSRGPAAVPPGHHRWNGPSTRGVSDEPLLRHAATQPRSVAGGLQRSDLERWLPHYRKWQQTERDFVGGMRACSCCGGVGFGGRHTTLHHKMGQFRYLDGEAPVGLLANPSWRISCSLARHGGRPLGTTAGLCGGPAKLAEQTSSGGRSKNRCSLRCPVSRSVTSGSWCPSLPAVSCTPPSYGALYASPTGPTGLFGPSQPTNCPSSAGHCLPPPQEKSWKQTLSRSFRWVGRGSIPE